MILICCWSFDTCYAGGFAGFRVYGFGFDFLVCLFCCICWILVQALFVVVLRVRFVVLCFRLRGGCKCGFAGFA